jgi:hypothetical protein
LFWHTTRTLSCRTRYTLVIQKRRVKVGKHHELKNSFRKKIIITKTPFSFTNTQLYISRYMIYYITVEKIKACNKIIKSWSLHYEEHKSLCLAARHGNHSWWTFFRWKINDAQRCSIVFSIFLLWTKWLLIRDTGWFNSFIVCSLNFEIQIF